MSYPINLTICRMLYYCFLSFSVVVSNQNTPTPTCALALLLLLKSFTVDLILALRLAFFIDITNDSISSMVRLSLSKVSMASVRSFSLL